MSFSGFARAGVALAIRSGSSRLLAIVGHASCGAAAPADRAETTDGASGFPVVRSLALTVSDLDRSIELFRALDFRLVDQHYARGVGFASWAGIAGAEMRVARLELGSEEIELRQFITPLGRSIAIDARSNDQSFQHMAIVVRDMDEAFARLSAVPGFELVSKAPQTLPLSNSAAGGIRALYFKDPDQHSLELIWFPPGKGQMRWQTQRASVFLGIDHSAIAVSDTARSIAFYEGLGFVIAGMSLNEGAEQAALSGVDGARVQITGLAAQSGPGVELLSYLAPGLGTKAPSDTAVNDLWHWEINVEVADLTAARQSVNAHGGRAHAVAVVTALEPGYRLASLVEDRDGHCLQLLQR